MIVASASLASAPSVQTIAVLEDVVSSTAQVPAYPRSPWPRYVEANEHEPSSI